MEDGRRQFSGDERAAAQKNDSPDTKDATTGTTPTNTKAGRKHTASGITERTAPARAAAWARAKYSLRASAATRSRTAATGEPVSA